VRAIHLCFFIMRNSTNRARLAGVPVAVLAVLGALSASAHAQPDTLEAVVVTATRTPVAQADVIGDVKVIEREILDQSAGLTLSEILRQHGGVQVASNGGLGKSASVFIRGTEARHVLLLIDGVRYGSATLGTPNWDNLPLSAIDRIEVLRGPAASLYGSDAVGGVVQIFTRRGAEGVLAPYAGLTLGSYGRREVSAGLTGGERDFSYALGVGHVQETGFSATNSQAQFGNFNPDRDGFEQQSMNAQVNWQATPAVELGANVVVSSADNQFDSSLNNSAHFDVRGLTTTRTLGLNAAKTWATGGVTRLQYGSADDLTRNLYLTSDTRFDTQRQQWTLQHEQATPIGNVLVGWDRVTEEVSSTTAYAVTRRATEGLFLGLQGRHGPHRWQANGRFDENSQFGSASTGSVGYSFALNPAWSAFALVGTSFKAPTFNQLYFPGFGNATTQPEEGESQEVGVDFARANSRLRLTYFEQSIRGFITTSPTVANIPRVQINGWSLDGQVAVDAWRFTGQLELLDARTQTAGANFNRKLPRRADQQLSLSVEKALAQWWLGAHALLVSERFDDLANTRRLPGYGTLSLSAERPLGNDWRLSVRLNNVGNKTYETAWGFNQPGRSIYTTLDWRPRR